MSTPSRQIVPRRPPMTTVSPLPLRTRLQQWWARTTRAPTARAPSEGDPQNQGPVPLARPLDPHAAKAEALRAAQRGDGKTGSGAAAEAALVAAGQAPQEVLIEAFDAQKQSLGVTRVLKISKTPDQWRQVLPPEVFEVAREAGTEPAFSGPYWDAHDDGIYRCACCHAALFDAAHQFESGTGWPSFTQPISGHNTVTVEDDAFGMARVEVLCRRCDAHLGHVFPDGPPPTGMRYCMNGWALAFVAKGQEDGWADR